MGNDINTVTVIGRLTRDGELKYTNSGTAVMKISIANNYRKKQGEQWIDEVNYFDATIWGKKAEGLQQYLVKGKQIAVKGELKQSRWEQEGQKRSKVEINAQDIQLLGGKDGQTASNNTIDGSIDGDFDDDIPF